MQAWITDEVGVERVGHVFARGRQIGNVGALVGMAVSVAVAVHSPRLAVMLGGALSVVFAAAAAFVMPETGFRRRPPDERENPLRELRGTARNGVRYTRAQPLILLLMAITFFAGASTESFDRLKEAHLLQNIGLPDLGGLDPVVWFGLLGAGSLVLGIGAQQLLVRRFDRVGTEGIARVLFAVTAVQAVAVLAFALSGSFALAVAAYWAYYVTRSVIDPAYDTWLNQSISDSSVRATVISISNQSDAIGQVAAAPPSARSAPRGACAPRSSPAARCSSRRSGCTHVPSGGTAASPSSSACRRPRAPDDSRESLVQGVSKE